MRSTFPGAHKTTRKRPPPDKMPFSDFKIMEAGYSRGRQRSLNAAVTKMNLDAVLRPYMLPIRRMAVQSGIDPILATNIIPYSEESICSSGRRCWRLPGLPWNSSTSLGERSLTHLRKAGSASRFGTTTSPRRSVMVCNF